MAFTPFRDPEQSSSFTPYNERVEPISGLAPLNFGTAIKGALEGAANFGPRQLNNLMVGGINKLLGTNLQPVSRAQTELLSPEERNTEDAKLGQFLGEMGVGAGFGAPAALGENLLMRAGLSRLPAALTSAGATGAGAGALINENDPAMGALVGGALGIGGEGIAQGLQRLFSGGAMRGIVGNNKITPEEFAARRAQVPQEMQQNVSVLDLANPDRANKFDLFAQTIPFGRTPAYQNMGDYIGGKLGKLAAGDIPEDLSGQAFNQKLNNYLASKDATNQAYQAFREQAPSIQAIDTPVKQAFSGIDDELKPLLNTKRGQEIYKDISNTLNSYRDMPIENYDQARIMKQLINDDLSKYADDRIAQRMLKKLKNGVEDVLNTPPVGASAEVNSLYKNANDARIAQGKFENLDMNTETPFYKIYRGQGEPMNFINPYLKASDELTNYAPLLGRLTENLTPDLNQAIGRALLRKTGTEAIEPTQAQMVNRLGKINKEQRQMLFGNMAKEAEDILNFAKAFPKGKLPESLPLTGFTGAKESQYINPMAYLMQPFVRTYGKFLQSNTAKNMFQNALKKQGIEPKSVHSLVQMLTNLLNSPNQQEPMDLYINRGTRRGNE